LADLNYSTNLVIPDYNGGKVNLVNPTTKTLTATNSSQNALNTLEYDGTDYWTCRNGNDQINLIRKTDGVTIKTSAIMGAWMYGYLSATQIATYSGNEKTF